MQRDRVITMVVADYSDYNSHDVILTAEYCYCLSVHLCWEEVSLVKSVISCERALLWLFLLSPLSLFVLITIPIEQLPLTAHKLKNNTLYRDAVSCFKFILKASVNYCDTAIRNYYILSLLLANIVQYPKSSSYTSKDTFAVGLYRLNIEH